MRLYSNLKFWEPVEIYWKRFNIKRFRFINLYSSLFCYSYPFLDTHLYPSLHLLPFIYNFIANHGTINSKKSTYDSTNHTNGPKKQIIKSQYRPIQLAQPSDRFGSHFSYKNRIKSPSTNANSNRNNLLVFAPCWVRCGCTQHRARPLITDLAETLRSQSARWRRPGHCRHTANS